MKDNNNGGGSIMMRFGNMMHAMNLLELVDTNLEDERIMQKPRSSEEGNDSVTSATSNTSSFPSEGGDSPVSVRELLVPGSVGSGGKLPRPDAVASMSIAAAANHSPPLIVSNSSSRRQAGHKNQQQHQGRASSSRPVAALRPSHPHPPVTAHHAQTWTRSVRWSSRASVRTIDPNDIDTTDTGSDHSRAFSQTSPSPPATNTPAKIKASPRDTAPISRRTLKEIRAENELRNKQKNFFEAAATSAIERAATAVVEAPSTPALASASASAQQSNNSPRNSPPPSRRKKTSPQRDKNKVVAALPDDYSDPIAAADESEQQQQQQQQQKRRQGVELRESGPSISDRPLTTACESFKSCSSNLSAMSTVPFAAMDTAVISGLRIVTTRESAAIDSSDNSISAAVAQKAKKLLLEERKKERQFRKEKRDTSTGSGKKDAEKEVASPSKPTRTRKSKKNKVQNVESSVLEVLEKEMHRDEKKAADNNGDDNETCTNDTSTTWTDFTLGADGKVKREDFKAQATATAWQSVWSIQSETTLVVDNRSGFSQVHFTRTE